jgi:hypothetical protein
MDLALIYLALPVFFLPGTFGGVLLFSTIFHQSLGFLSCNSRVLGGGGIRLYLALSRTALRA